MTYPNHTAGRTPKMLNSHTATIATSPMMIGQFRPNPVPVWSPVAHVASGNHSATTSVPTIRPLMESTTDQPIQ